MESWGSCSMIHSWSWPVGWGQCGRQISSVCYCPASQLSEPPVQLHALVLLVQVLIVWSIQVSWEVQTRDCWMELLMLEEASVLARMISMMIPAVDHLLSWQQLCQSLIAMTACYLCFVGFELGVRREAARTSVFGNVVPHDCYHCLCCWWCRWICVFLWTTDLAGCDLKIKEIIRPESTMSGKNFISFK